MQISKEQVLKVLEAHLKMSRNLSRNTSTSGVNDELTPGQIQQVFEKIQEIPEIRADRIKPLERRVKQGHYNVSDDDVAEKMVYRVAADTLIIKDDRSTQVNNKNE